MIDGLWSLPGPARFVAAIDDVLLGGGSCAVLAPAVLRADEGWLTGLEGASNASIDMITVEEGRPPAAVVADHARVDWSPGPGAAGRLAQSGVFNHSVMGLALPPNAPEWAEFAAEFLASVPARSDTDRPQLLIFCGEDDRTALRAKRLPISEVWWWGAVDRLDTTIAATRELGAAADPIHVACITELCGFDIGFVPTLAKEWDGSLSTLLDLVSSDAAGSHTAVKDSSTLTHRASPPPPASFLQDWNAGLVDAWGRYQPFVAPTALSPDTRDEVLRTRLWRGQLRELMPLVDEERARLEAWVTSGPIADREATFPMEIGPLARLMSSDAAVRLRSSRTRRDAAHWLKNTRNELAHRNVLSLDHISEGLALLDSDRRAR